MTAMFLFLEQALASGQWIRVTTILGVTYYVLEKKSASGQTFSSRFPERIIAESFYVLLRSR